MKVSKIKQTLHLFKFIERLIRKIKSLGFLPFTRPSQPLSIHRNQGFEQMGMESVEVG